MNRIFFLITMFSAANSIAGAVPPKLQLGENFSKARVRLYADGWRADPGAHASSGEYFGVDRLLIQKGYDEVDFCSMGKSLCIFQYIKNNKCLRLQTQGEQIHAMKIEHWSDECRAQAVEETRHMPPADVRYLAQWYSDCENFGRCKGFDRYFLKLKKKYAHDTALTKELRSYTRPANSDR